MARVRSGAAILSLIALALGLAACPGATTISLDADLNRLYAAKTGAELANSTAELTSAQTDLSALSSRALEQAESAPNPLDAIALYRIAAIAAWQAGNADVVTIGERGEAVCAARQEGPNSVPRDCAMLMVVPLLAANDEIVSSIGVLQKKREAQGGVLDESDVPATVAEFESAVRTYDRFHQRQLAIDPLDAPVEFKAALNEHGAVIACNVGAAFSLIGSAAGVPSDPVTQARASRNHVEELYEGRNGVLVCPAALRHDLFGVGSGEQAGLT